MPISQGATEAAEGNDIGAGSGKPQDLPIAATYGERDAVPDWKVIKPGLIQTQVSAVDGNGLAFEEAGHGVSELDQPTRTVAGRGALATDHFPFAECMPGAKAEQHPSGSENVEGGTGSRTPDCSM